MRADAIESSRAGAGVGHAGRNESRPAGTFPNPLVAAPFALQILECIDRLAETAWQGWLKNSTHFFWGCNDGRLFPLWLDGAVLRSKGSEEMRVAFSPVSLIRSSEEWPNHPKPPADVHHDIDLARRARAWRKPAHDLLPTDALQHL